MRRFLRCLAAIAVLLALPGAHAACPNPATSGEYGNCTFVDNFATPADLTLATLTAQGSGTLTTADQTNASFRGLQLGINITAISGTSPTLTVTIQGKDTTSGQYYTLLTSTALNATGFTLLTVYPGAPSTANASIPQVLPHIWRVQYVVAGTTPSVTATIGASILP